MPLISYEDMAERLKGSPNHRVLRRIGRHELVDAPPDSAVGIALDVETTGLSHDTDEVIEIAASRFRFHPETGEMFGVERTVDMMIDPGRPIPAKITALTGITDDRVKGQVFDRKPIEYLVADAAIVIAHNAAFDRPFAEKLCPIFEHLPWACTLSQIDWSAEGIESGKLGWLLTEFGFFYDRHHAGSDVDALVELLGSTLPKSRRSVLDVVVDARLTPTWNVWAVGAPYEMKDELRARGYRWSSGQPKAWHLDDVPAARAHEEKAWLLDFCRPRFYEVDALRRFTKRSQ